MSIEIDDAFVCPQHSRELSAESLVYSIAQAVSGKGMAGLSEGLRLLEAAFARQREKGREEREGELASMHEAWCDDLKERYAALEEAARKRITTSCVTCGWKDNCHGCAYSEIRKALHDLDEGRK